MRPHGTPSVTVLVPVKPVADGKSRLRVPDDVRPDLAAAFAADTVAAASAAPGVARVLVVSRDRSLARVLPSGVQVVADPVPGNLNASLRAVARTIPGAGVVAALCADLPALTSPDLAEALAGAGAVSPAFVADAEGAGTTTYVAPAEAFDPRFGAGSAAAHRTAGARPVPGALATLRADVDDAAGLARAVRLGVGQRTAAVLARLSAAH